MLDATRLVDSKSDVVSSSFYSRDGEDLPAREKKRERRGGKTMSRDWPGCMIISVGVFI